MGARGSMRVCTRGAHIGSVAAFGFEFAAELVAKLKLKFVGKFEFEFELGKSRAERQCAISPWRTTGCAGSWVSGGVAVVLIKLMWTGW